MKQSRADEADETFVNYLPGGPTPGRGTGRVERFLRTLFRRRGPLRPAVREDDGTVARSDD
jgi:hypothetical protein